ncbi:MAG: GNAT family N-acetyltransferase [Rickettsiales bacterium]|nr:MAG: GNAT family N-acetyltransferase [Rickettsiales bacterium]
MQDFRITHFDKKFDYKSFSCGEDKLDRYIKEIASQNIKIGISSVYVLLDENKVIGFYTISSYTLNADELPKVITKNFPKDLPIPSCLIGRFAVDKNYQNQGFGSILLTSALKRTKRLSKEVAFSFIVVNAKDKIAKQFYTKYGFEEIVGNPLKLYLSIK